MAWSKVSNQHKKPLRWWYHKILCEFFYWLSTRWFCVSRSESLGWYYNHLNAMCCKCKFNLYGEPINN